MSASSVGKSKRTGKKKTMCALDLLRAHLITHCMPLQRLHDNSASQQALPLDSHSHKQGLLFHIGPNEIAAYMKHLHSSEFRIMHLGGSTSQRSS